MSIASEFWKSTITLIEEKIQKYIPYRAEVTHSEDGLVRIRTYDADSGMMEKFPQLHGQSLSAGDEVAVIELGGKPFVLGRIKKNLTGTNALNTFDGAIHIDSSASNALMVTNRLTSSEVFRVNAATKDAVLAGRFITGGLSVSPTSNTTDSFVVKDSSGSEVFRINSATGGAVMVGRFSAGGLTVSPGTNTTNTFLVADSSGSEVFRVNSILGDAVLRGKLNASDLVLQARTNSDSTLAVLNTAGTPVFRVNTAVGSMFVQNEASIDGVTADKASLTPPRFFQSSSQDSSVGSTTNTSTFQNAITRSYSLGAGTWTVYLIGGQMLRHSANGGSAYRVRIGSSASSGIVTGFYSTAYTQGIDSHAVTGQSGTIELAAEYRSSGAGTTTSKAPWILMLAVRTG